jgi:peptide-methionine (S)-S-oxide reductase
MKKIIPLLVFFVFFSTTSHAEKAIFAGGCFWCIEADFEKLDGVMNVISGYTGGHTKNPGYEQVTSGNTGHYEAVEVEYNPQKISYAELLDYFWRHIDPFDAKGQFCDKGDSYRAAIFTHNAEQAEEATLSKIELQSRLDKSQTITTSILPASAFYPAEAYHQNYYKTNPVRYDYYRWRCGRDARLKELWNNNK